MNPEELKLIQGYRFVDLKIGMVGMFSKTLTETDLRNFSGVSGDTNPMHLNHEYAAASVFKDNIVHGMLTASLISTVIGTKLPGPGCIYVSQTLNFKAPVKVGDTVYAKATVSELLPEKKRAVLDTVCIVRDVVVIQGKAVVQVP